MAKDPAYEFFAEDARKQGISLYEYQRRYGIDLMLDKKIKDGGTVPLYDDGDHPQETRSGLAPHEHLDEDGCSADHTCPSCQRRRAARLHTVE